MSRPLVSIQSDMLPVSGEFLESHPCILQSHQGRGPREGLACPDAPCRVCFSYRGLPQVVEAR